ncbi:hypothetical protein [Lederbergia galactosidilytica]|uniref:Uncharacterized protein n=1 Tax=Lederbergia galactosidilytica TaxID=217031 RepID=A0A177ZID9_9BACI|nr:hypothetical protein [Lederbergia galactosidilytica]MBP1915551.1 hypothetical protein [Lederbergia galactosidilytica]OAK67534.1 hypothetical protein ABB05_20640 [Lederbergia galactosidilytica]
MASYEINNANQKNGIIYSDFSLELRLVEMLKSQNRPWFKQGQFLNFRPTYPLFYCCLKVIMNKKFKTAIFVQ